MFENEHKFNRLENTFDFKYEIGDFIEATFLSINDGSEAQGVGDRMFILKVIELNKGGEIKKVALVREKHEETGLIEEQEGGILKCPTFNILKYGFVDLATKTGVVRWKSLIPEIQSDKTHFIMGKFIARKKEN